MKFLKTILSFIAISISLTCISQDVKPFVAEGKAKYFDFREGTWFLLKEVKTLDSTSYFKIKRGSEPIKFYRRMAFSTGMNTMAYVPGIKRIISRDWFG